MIEEKILNLIKDKREGRYWDFKVEYHKNKAELLHDIICLANNLSNEEAYLILGVADNGHIKGVNNDPNRKKQEELLSFIEGKNFAGGKYPYVLLRTIKYEEKEIDIIIIRPDDKVPYYLESSFTDDKAGKSRTVNAGSIYTRTEDKNTPINTTANPLDTETLWKIHFGLHPEPIKRLQKYLLFSNKWIKNTTGYFYNESPEYTIYNNEEYSDEYFSLDAPFYAYNQTNSNVLYSQYECKYHDTVLASEQCITLDSGNYTTPTPEQGVITSDLYNKDTIYYRYFIEDTLIYNLHLFMYNEKSMEQQISRNKFLECILIFKNDSERKEFENYIYKNFDEVNELINNNQKRVFGIEHLDDIEQKDIIRKINTGRVLNKQFLNFRKNYN
ncbi:ATP-binding protein [Staphylococcus epidermidis]|nr:ATP-binding protein [Staphylococcus epidermidis]